MSNTKTVMGQAANTQGLPLDITDVFSTYLYEGLGTVGGPQNIVNGINLAEEGGLFWAKSRSSTQDGHTLFDTERGVGSQLSSDSTAAEVSYQSNNRVTSFNTDGVTLNGYGAARPSTSYASWTFRKAPKFFDVVTYTGTGSARTVPHNLGSVPGVIIIKKTNAVSTWPFWHRSVYADSTSGRLLLNETSAAGNSGATFNSTAPTDTEFTVGSSNDTNANNNTYVAYLFAHNDGDGEFGPGSDQDIIKCGSYTTDGSEEATIDLGWEPQWVLFKRTDSSTGGDWCLFDTMRGLTADTSGDGAKLLEPNTSDAELATSRIAVTSTGFKVDNYGSSRDFIYIAIRRGPLAPPKSATEVFDIQFNGGNDPSKAPKFQSGFVTDMAIGGYRTGGSVNYPYTGNRLMGLSTLETHNTDAEEAGGGSFQWDFMNGFIDGVPSVITDTQIAWMWKRAPNYFDVVAYTGNGTAGRTVSHNLGVAPEMMWVKRRNAVSDWNVYNQYVAVDAETDYLNLNNTAPAQDASVLWNDTAPSSSEFTLGNNSQVNTSGGTYIAYLFASLAGISKVGSYVGTGVSGNDVDCGFTSGARFVLIRRVNGDEWMVFDTTRGITSANNDPKLALNSTAAENQNAARDLDPLNSGFTVNGTDTGVNKSGDTYIFYAIA
jgi:hypothetical protein